MTKLLTVLIPTYNNHELFSRLLRTYLKDSRVLILVSDDSDNYKEKKLIESTCKDNNISYFEGTKKSPPENWNYLLSMVKTPFFVLNHHDEYPDNLNFLDVIDSNKIGLIILPCSSKVGNAPLHKLFSWQQKYFSQICMLWPNASLNMILAPTASVIVNSRYKNVFFDLNLKWFVDAEWYIKLFSLSSIDKRKILFYFHTRIFSFQAKNSITTSLKENLKKQIKKEKDYLRIKGLIPIRIIRLFQLLSLILISIRSKLNIIIAKFLNNY
tara:strand:- start:7054 stop:7860 length:807 start_codon:yes stop_codon:yes gene_type:complete